MMEASNWGEIELPWLAAVGAAYSESDSPPES